MPEGREFPYNYIPRVGMHLSITFGEPIPAEDFGILLNSQPGSLCKRPEASNCTETIDNPELARIRSEVTAVAQHALEALGRRISGNLLGA
jgi:monolysocardiolipin acyltransferase